MNKVTLREKIYILLLIVFINSNFSVYASSGDMFYYFDNVLSKLSTSIKDASADILPLNFKTLSGNWNLMYGNDYGYSFRFFKNYRAIVIVYLNTNSVIFKGVYNIENSNAIRINISEMKRVESVKELDRSNGVDSIYDGIDYTPRYPEGKITGLFKAIVFGLIAGFILNFMPCVLPVVSDRHIV